MTTYSLTQLELENILTAYPKNKGKSYEDIFEEYALREWEKFKLLPFPYPIRPKKTYLTELTKLKNKPFSELQANNNLSRKQSVTVKGFHKSIFETGANTPRNSCVNYWSELKTNFKKFKNLYRVVLKHNICNWLYIKNKDYHWVEEGVVPDANVYWQGIYFSKYATAMGYFKPLMAKYLIQKYLSNYKTIRDPFSGYSGRMLGAWSLDKNYIGSDLNYRVVEESNQIIQFLNENKLLNSSLQVFQEDLLKKELSDVDKNLDTNNTALFTCSPYSDNEVYSDETVFLECDEWIDKVLEKYKDKIKTYLFVCDQTILESKYKDNVVEKIINVSPFNKVKKTTNFECVVLVKL